MLYVPLCMVYVCHVACVMYEWRCAPCVLHGVCHACVIPAVFVAHCVMCVI